MTQKQPLPLEPISEEDRRTIDLQLERLLGHPLFRLSKRLRVFLQFVVQESLDNGEGSPPKERTLGIAVFGRKVDYDTSADPIVRVTATELRKKLAQYYYEDGHNDEIRIELPPGSYLPKFRRVISNSDVVARAEEPAPASELFDAPGTLNQRPLSDEPRPLTNDAPSHYRVDAAEASEYNLPTTQTESKTTRVHAKWRLAIGLLFLPLVIVPGVYLPLFRARHLPPSRTLWKSFGNSSNDVLIVMPVIGHGQSEVALRPSDVSVKPNLSIEDTTIATKVAVQLDREGLRYRLASSSEVGFDELRTGPAVLIGALDNIWTLRLTKDLPFVFEESEDGRMGRILETGKEHRVWAIDITTPHTRITRDYGIVALYHNRLTGEPTLVVAGISSQGTQAAGELLTTSAGLDAALAKDYKPDNFEIVVETEAIDGRSGPPQIVAKSFW